MPLIMRKYKELAEVLIFKQIFSEHLLRAAKVSPAILRFQSTGGMIIFSLT